MAETKQCTQKSGQSEMGRDLPGGSCTPMLEISNKQTLQYAGPTDGWLMTPTSELGIVVCLLVTMENRRPTVAGLYLLGLVREDSTTGQNLTRVGPHRDHLGCVDSPTAFPQSHPHGSGISHKPWLRANEYHKLETVNLSRYRVSF